MRDMLKVDDLAYAVRSSGTGQWLAPCRGMSAQKPEGRRGKQETEV